MYLLVDGNFNMIVREGECGLLNGAFELDGIDGYN